MEIINNKLNSLPQQVEENMKNIELLAQYLKEAYKTSLTLLSSDTTIAISNTNADDSVQSGWLFDSIGNLFKITGGDGTNLLIEFYTCLKGQDGRDGADDIDDNTTANNKLWSSEKTSNTILELIDDNNALNNKTWSSNKISQIISYVKDKGIFASNNLPTLLDGNLYYEITDILNQSTPNPPRYSDLVIYIDGDGKAKYLYQITGVSGDETKYYVSQIAEIGGGKQLYQHNISIYSGSTVISIQIINDDSTLIDTFNKLANYLKNNGFTGSANKYLQASGVMVYGELCIVSSVFYDSNNNDGKVYGNKTSGSAMVTVFSSLTLNISDNVITL